LYWNDNKEKHHYAIKENDDDQYPYPHSVSVPYAYSLVYKTHETKK